MIAAPLPPDEAARLEALRRYGVVGTDGGAAFDDITAIASQICGTPIALVSLLDEDRQWFLSSQGLDARETPRDLAFCAHAILDTGAMIVPDAHVDVRFADNPLVTGAPHVRFYAGTPLVTPDGHALGTLCVIDSEKRQLEPGQVRALEALGRQVVAQLELQRTATALKESESQLRTVTSAIRSGIVVHGPHAEILWSNEAACYLLGLSADQLAGRTSFDPTWNVIYPDGTDFPNESHPAVEALRTGWSVNGVVMGVYRPTTLDRIWLLVDAVPQLDRSGRASRVIVTFVDITRRKLAEERIRDESARYQSILSSSPLAIITTGLDGVVTTFNAAAERLLGYRADDVIGHYSPGIFHDVGEVVARAAQFSEELGETIAPGFDVFIAKALRDLPNEHEWTYVRRNASRVPVLLSVVVIRDGAGVPTGYLGVAADITERRQAEQALVAAKELAEETTRAKSDFLATMSHEIRTPMNGVLGMTTLLNDTPLSPEQRSYATTIERSATLLLGVINDILDFSKLEAGKLDIDARPFDVGDAVADVAELLAVSAAAKQVQLVVVVAPDVPRQLVGDAGRVRQVLLNLVGNAVKFTARGHVHLALRYTDGDAARLRVDVTDTGIGIPTSVQARLFSAFSQADASTTRRFGGTGLGLSISRRLVELMGGTIGVRSTEGIGSQFWFELPLSAPADSPPIAPIEPGLPGASVMIVDALDVARETSRESLAAAGARVIVASTAHEATSRLHGLGAAGTTMRAVVIDATTAGEELDVLLALLQTDRRLGAPAVVVLNAFGTRDDIARLEAAGVDAYLAKPLAPRLLARTVGTLLRRGASSPRPPMLQRHALDAADAPEPAAAAALRRQSRAADAAAIVGSAATPHTPPVGETSVPGTLADAPHILLAEDNPVNQLVAVKLLEKLGCRVEVVGDGAEALAKVEHNHYDIVFMDVQMPVMDGLEATQRIRALSPSRRVPIVAMTANAMMEDQERCLAAGMSAFVSKPITPDSLRKAVDEALALAATMT